jgi:AcrR family transcriptional regulator
MKGVKTAQQERSRQMHQRLVAALERLLKDKPFENISVAEIAKEAGASVGAVYTRFENKDAFIPVLFELYQERHAAYVEETTHNAPPVTTLRDALQNSMVAGWHFLTSESHLLRAVHLYSRIRPDLVGPY